MRVIIDDYHSIIGSPIAEDFLSNILMETPLKCLIATRLRPSWVSARHLLYGEVEELNASALALTSDEARSVLGEAPGASELAHAAHGWPAVISLAAQASITRPMPRDASLLYDFFADEIYDGCAESKRDDLMQLALLPTIEPETVHKVFGYRGADIVASAAAVGFAARHGDSIELHPLAREFLLTKVENHPEGRAHARAAVELCFDDERWDEAFALLQRFRLTDQLTRLVELSLEPLSNQGRVSTLETFAQASAAQGGATPGVLDLIEAEVALRDGVPLLARTAAAAAISNFPSGHPLSARAYLIAGSAAFLENDLVKASRLNRLAKQAARTPRDRVEALWGECLALMYREDPSFLPVLGELEHVAPGSPRDAMRYSTVEMQSRRLAPTLGDLSRPSKIKNAADVREPRALTSFLNTLGYLRALQAEYDVSLALFAEAMVIAERFKLTFATPHIQWSIAHANLGLRRFTVAAKHLRIAEKAAATLSDQVLDLNCRVLRARCLLAQQRPNEAIEYLTADFPKFQVRAMHGEYVATRGFCLAVLGDRSAAEEASRRALEISQTSEARGLASATEAILFFTSDGHGVPQVLEDAWKNLAAIRIWDIVIAALRSEPKLIEAWKQSPRRAVELVRILTLSNDRSLTKKAGLTKDGTGGSSSKPLSKRELEIFDLLCQGLRNQEIAKTLFIAPSTVKLHVRHILEKLGARTRAEAAARGSQLGLSSR